MRIETEHLIIRPPMICDADRAYNLRTDEETNRYIGGVTSLDIDRYRERFEKFCSNYDPSKPYIYSIILKESGEYIGYCGIQYCSVMDEQEIAYGVHSQNWGKGYVSEAARAVLKYVSSEFRDYKLFAAVNPQNIASEKILNAIGFEFYKHIIWPEQGKVNMYRYLNYSPEV